MNTETWRWYCRICGAEGEESTRESRDRVALEHVNEECETRRCSQFGVAEAGTLLHVWRYGEWTEQAMLRVAEQLLTGQEA